MILCVNSAFSCASAVFIGVPSTQQASEVKFSNLGFVDRSACKGKPQRRRERGVYAENHRHTASFISLSACRQTNRGALWWSCADFMTTEAQRHGDRARENPNQDTTTISSSLRVDLDRGCPRVARRIECPRLNLVTLVWSSRNSPIAAIRRTRVSTLQRAIHQKFNSCYSDVIVRRRVNCNSRLSRDIGTIRGASDRYGWRDVISSSRKPDPIY